MNDLTKYLSTRELSERWDCTMTMLRGWRHRGKGPPWRNLIGKKSVYYLIDDVERFEEENELEVSGG